MEELHNRSGELFTEEELLHIDSTSEQFLSDSKAPAVSFAVAKNGRLVLARAYGYADRENEEAANTGHFFRVASVSKPITAIAVLKLYEAGELDLDSPVFGEDGILGEDFGPYEENTLQVSVRHLLSHTSGGWGNKPQCPMFLQPELDHYDLINYTLREFPLVNVPGEVYEYSNFGYCLLGRIIEKISGKTYEEFCVENIFEPCGASAYISGNSYDEKGGYEAVNYEDETSPAYRFNVRRMDAHGGWVIRPADLLKVMSGLDSEELLSEDTVRMMVTPYNGENSGYGLGWSSHGFEGNWWHTGLMLGTSSIIVHTSKGLSWAAALNKKVEADKAKGIIDVDSFMWKIVNGIQNWPEEDLFDSQGEC